MDILKKGSKGTLVKLLLSYLGILLDGDFGGITENAVKEFLKSHNLKLTGIVDSNVWKLLISDSSSKLNGIPLVKTYRTINGIILHCTATKEGMSYTVELIDKLHKSLGWQCVGYHYVIYADGSIHNGRDINKIGSHCAGHNTGTIGIVYVGGLDKLGKPKDTRTKLQKEALVKLVKQLMTMYKLNKNQIHCHNEYANKACPSFKIDTFRKEL